MLLVCVLGLDEAYAARDQRESKHIYLEKKKKVKLANLQEHILWWIRMVSFSTYTKHNSLIPQEHFHDHI